jgi:hypothetical protein
MKTRTKWLAIGLAAILVLMAGAAGALPGRLEPEAVVASKINYQGRLTDPMGNPLTGTYPMRFVLYDDALVGVSLWDSGVMNVEVNDGTFSVDLNIDAYHFNGQGLWLRIWIDGDWLTPRQELVPAPYALSLRPGAEIRADAPTNWVFRASNTNSYATGSAIWGSAATGSAVYGNSAGGYGLYGYSDTGNALVANANAKTAGVFDSNQGYGIRVNADGTDHWDHAGYFTSNMGYGVYAVSAGNYGVRGEGGTTGVYGTGVSQGVFGYSNNGDGVSGSSNNLYGMSGSSYTYYGTEGYTWRGDNNYGLFSYDNLYSLNFNKSGAMMQVAQNSGDAALEPGDVVILTGIVEPKEPGGPLVIQVARASEANSSAVAGVVYSRFNLAAVLPEGEQVAAAGGEPLQVTMDGPVPPGEHLLLVVQGPVKVKASALEGTIQPGDLLSSAGQVGYAARTAKASAAPGTVFGKALEALADGSGQIYVYVTLQ